MQIYIRVLDNVFLNYGKFLKKCKAMYGYVGFLTD